MDASVYIAEQIPQLQALHAQLALPPTALAEDKARIDAVVRAAIVSVVRSREDEVARWEAQIADGKRALVGLARAVGERGRSIIAGNRESEGDGLSLPAQHEKLVRQTEELEVVYNERLAKIEQLITTIDRLSVLLGPPFESAAPLQAIPGSAVPATAQVVSQLAPQPRSARTSMATGAQLAPTINQRLSGGRKSSAASLAPAPAPAPEPRPTTWMDVGEEVMGVLEGQVDAALAERDLRLRNLESSLNDLMWYHRELDLPSLASHDFPDPLRPPRAEEEQPGAHTRYEELLTKLMAVNRVPSGGEDDEASEMQGLEGIEPEIGLMHWATDMLELWMAEKEDRDATIQGLYEKIEPLWGRLEVPQDFIDMFIEANRGSGLSTIAAYEQELERVLEIRRTSLSSFVVGIRKEIATLQETLLLSDDEKADFGAFIDDEYTEELLSEHEAEAERLRSMVEILGPLLPRVKEWLQLLEDEAELERNANDPNRFKKRGSAMLVEERMRKRVEKLKPKIEAELLNHLPAWEEEHGRPFLARGERVVDTIEGALAAKEAAKEAKKRAKLGLGPSVPASGRSTPAVRSASGGMKRSAPTPTPGQPKRPRVGMSRPPPSTSTLSTSASMRPPARVRRDPYATPTYTTPTPATATARRFGQPASARANVPPLPSGEVFKTRPQPVLRPGLVAAKVEPKRRRESFKPRSSYGGGLLGPPVGLAELSEEEDVF